MFQDSQTQECQLRRLSTPPFVTAAFSITYILLSFNNYWIISFKWSLPSSPSIFLLLSFFFLSYYLMLMFIVFLYLFLSIFLHTLYCLYHFEYFDKPYPCWKVYFFHNKSKEGLELPPVEITHHADFYRPPPFLKNLKKSTFRLPPI